MTAARTQGIPTRCLEQLRPSTLRVPVREENGLVVIYHPGEVELAPTEAEVVRQWLSERSATEPLHEVALGCCNDTPPAGRLQRRRALMRWLESCGLSPSRIHCTETWTELATGSSPVDLPFDVVWIKALRPGSIAAIRRLTTDRS